MQNERRKIMKNLAEDNKEISSIEQILNLIRFLFKDKIREEGNVNNIYTFEINGIMNKFDRAKLEKVKDDSITIEIGKNNYQKKTILYLWSHELRM